MKKKNRYRRKENNNMVMIDKLEWKKKQGRTLFLTQTTEIMPKSFCSLGERRGEKTRD